LDLKRIATERSRLELASAPEGFDALAMADIARARQDATLYVARDGSRADAFLGALNFFDPELPVLRFPAWDCLPYDRTSPSPAVAAGRMARCIRWPCARRGKGRCWWSPPCRRRSSACRRARC
jgi:transcription-repair coupling factor (superfamily II helicase)